MRVTYSKLLSAITNFNATEYSNYNQLSWTESEDNDINLNLHDQIEFTEWTWTSYWHPIRAGVEFKREAYRQVLSDLLPFYIEYKKV